MYSLHNDFVHLGFFTQTVTVNKKNFATFINCSTTESEIEQNEITKC